MFIAPILLIYNFASKIININKLDIFQYLFTKFLILLAKL